MLVLGGIGHSFGIARLYLTAGVPDANRVLLDVWVGQAQLIGGSLYLYAFSAGKQGARWQAFATFAALTIIFWTAPVLPVLLVRAPFPFMVPALVYLAASMWVLLRVWMLRRNTDY